MGVCHLQHRIVTGLHAVNGLSFAGFHSRYIQKVGPDLSEILKETLKNNVRSTLYSLTVMLYAFILISVITVATNLTFKDIPKSMINNYIQVQTSCVQFNNRTFLNIQTITILIYATRLNYYLFRTAVFNFGFLGTRYKKLSGSYKIHFFLSFWHTLLNLLLIVISFPAIKNPGPYQEDLTFLYQNVRGFVPFKELGKTIPCLDHNKIIEFQNHIF